jgi:hypothetical protein
MTNAARLWPAPALIFEITQDYQILVPLMVANLLSFTISRRYQPVPIHEALLRQEQLHLPSSALRATAGGQRATCCPMTGRVFRQTSPWMLRWRSFA